MSKKYEKPVVETLKASEVLELMGPVQALSSGVIDSAPIPNVGGPTAMGSHSGSGSVGRR